MPKAKLGQRGRSILGAWRQQDVLDVWYRRMYYSYIIFCLTFPERTASSNASGIDAAEVLPYSDRFVITWIFKELAKTKASFVIRGYVHV